MKIHIYEKLKDRQEYICTFKDIDKEKIIIFDKEFKLYDFIIHEKLEGNIEYLTGNITGGEFLVYRKTGNFFNKYKIEWQK